MAESSIHMRFVGILETEAKKLIPSYLHALIYVDNPENRDRAPRMIGNYVPDCYFRGNGLLLIGEAKTAEDVERKHSLAQYQDYFNEASKFEGESIIVMSVPWYTKNCIKNIYRRMKRQSMNYVKVFVVCEIGEAEEVE